MSHKYQVGDVLDLIDTSTKEVFEHILIVDVTKDHYCNYSLTYGDYSKEPIFVLDTAMSVRRVS